MSKKPTAQECHALTTKYIDLYTGRYGEKPQVNRYSARWGFESILMDYSYRQAVSLLEYFFSTYNDKGHPLDWFLYNYEKLVEKRDAAEKREVERAKMRKESEQRVKEWREHGNIGIEGD